MTCNSFRLLEVFNRHFKLKKEKACKGKKQNMEWTQKEQEGERGRYRKGKKQERAGEEEKQGKKLEKKEIRLLASSQIFAFPLNQSVLQPNPLSADKSMQIEGLIGLSCLQRT